jgi:hypothetical protein
MNGTEMLAKMLIPHQKLVISAIIVTRGFRWHRSQIVRPDHAQIDHRWMTA